MAGIARPDELMGLPTPDRDFGIRNPLLATNPMAIAEGEIRSKGQELRRADREKPLSIGKPTLPPAPKASTPQPPAPPSISDEDFFKPRVVGGAPDQGASNQLATPGQEASNQPISDDDFFKPRIVGQGFAQTSAPTDSAPAEDDFFKPRVAQGQPGTPVTTTQPQEEEGWIEGIGKALGQGTQQTGSSLVAAGGTVANSEGTVVGSARFSAELEKNSDLQALKRLNADIERDKAEYAGQGGLTELWGGVKNVVGNMFANPKGAAEFLASQLPNSAVALGSGAAGAAAGTAVMPGVGTAVGFVAGMFLANTALETGNKAQEKARDGNFTAQDRSEAVEEGVTKGAVITAVDTVTLGASKYMAGVPGRTVEAATARVLERNGLNSKVVSQNLATDTKVAMDAAKALPADQAKQAVEDAVLKSLTKNGLTNPALVREIREAQTAALGAVNKFTSKAGRVTTALGLETVGEGVGEYLGEYAATGKADITDAVMEAFAGLGTSVGELRMLAKQAELNPGTLTKATAGMSAPSSSTKSGTSSPGEPSTQGTTDLDRGFGLVRQAFERTINVTEGENMLGAMWATGDANTRKIVQTVLERSGKLDLIDTLNLTGTEAAQANPRVQAGMQMMSDIPAFARDFAFTAQQYATIQPSQLAKPKWDKRKNAPVVEGVDPLNQDEMTPEELDAINAEAQQASQDASERAQSAGINLTDLTPEELDQINAEAQLAGAASQRSGDESARTMSAEDKANYDAKDASRSGRVLMRTGLDGQPLSVADETASQNIERVVDAGGDGKAVLQTIINDPNTSEFHREIATKLMGMNVNPSVVFATNINDGQAVGGYDPAPNRISLDRYNGGSLTPLVLHEYIHAMTRSSSWLQTKIGKEMVALYRKYEKFKGPNSSYGFESADEFFSELLSNPEFQAEVKSLKVDGIVGQLWNRFVEIIAKMLGIKRKDIVAKALDITYRAAAEKPSLQGDVERADRLYQMREQGLVAMRGNERGQTPIATRQTDAGLVSDITLKEREAKALDTKIGVSGLAMDLPRTLIEATVAKAPKNADSMAALQEFADSLEPLIKARREYDALTRGKEVLELKDAAAALRVAEREGVDLTEAQARLAEATEKRPELLAKYRVLKSNLDAATAAYESAMRKMDGGKEAQLPERYFDRDLERATAERTPKYETSKQAKADAPAAQKAALAKRTELRQKFINQLLTGDMEGAFASWAEYYGPNKQKVNEEGKVGKEFTKTKFEQNRFNEMISAIRWVYNNMKDEGGNKNPGLKALLDRTWAQKQAFEANRKSFLWNMVHNKMFRDIMEEAIKDMRQGVIKLSNNIDEIRKSPRVRELLAEGLTDRQKALVGKLIAQTTLQDLTAYYETKFWDSRKQGELEITTNESEAIQKYQRHLDQALNGMYRTARSEEAGVQDIFDEETGEISQKGTYDDVLQSLRNKHAELVAMASEYSRGASDESAYLIAMMTPQREGIAVDASTMSDFTKGQEALETRYTFDPDNVDRSAIQQMANELAMEIREMEVNRTRNRARVFQHLGNQIFTNLAIARRDAAQAGLPTQMVDQMFFDSVKTLHIGLGVKLNRNALLLAMPNDAEAVDNLLNRGRAEEKVLETVAETTQENLFTEQDLEDSDRVAAIVSFIEDVKAGRMKADAASTELQKAIRAGELSAPEIRAEFKKRGVDVPVEQVNLMMKLPYRVSLRNHLAQHGGDRLYYHQWMTDLEKLGMSHNLVELGFGKMEMKEYQRWKDNKKRMLSRLSSMERHADADSAVWVFSDLLFANYSLDQMRDLNLIENVDDRNLIRSLFLDPVNQWHKDLEHARLTRPELAKQVLMPTGGVTDLVSSADATAHLEWKAIRDSIGQRDNRIASDIQHVEELINEAFKDRVIDDTRLDDRFIEEVRYYLPEDMVNEVDPDEAGAVPVKRKVLVPGLRSTLYRLMPSERRAAVTNWLRINASGYNTERVLEEIEQEDMLRSNTQTEFESQAVEEFWSNEAQGEEAVRAQDDEATYEQYLQDMQEAGAWDEDDVTNSYDSDNRLRQGAYSGVVSVATLQAWVSDKTSTWTSAPNIEVMGNYHHLPEPLLSQVKAKLAQNMGAKGLYDGATNTVYMFADHINGEADAEFTLFHEVFGHYGMRGLLGKEFDSFLSLQYKTNPKLRAMAELKMAEGMPMLEAMDEVLSDMSAAVEAPSVYQMYVGKVIASLRKIGLGKVADWFAFLTHAELAYTLEASKRAVKTGVLNAGGAPGVLRMAEQKNPYEMFVVTKDGKTRAYARYNPIIDEWYVFKSQGSDIRDGNYTVYGSSDYEGVLRDLQSLGKVESRMRSSRFIDNKVPADFIKLPKFSELSKWKKRARLARIGIQNEYAPVWNLVEHLVAEGRMSKDFDLKTALTLYERRTAASVERYNKQFVEPIMEALDRLKKAGKLTMPSFMVNGNKIETVNDLVNTFLVAQTAEERNAQILRVGGKADGSGMSNADANKILKFVQDQSYYADLIEIGNKLDELSQFKIDLEVKAGLISADDAVKRMGAYKHYRNLSGVRAELDEDASSDPSLNIGRKFNLRGTDKRAMGRGDIAPDVLARTLLGGEASVIRAHKNEIAQKVLMLFETNYDPNFVVINEIKSARQINRETGLIEVNDDPNYIKRPDVMIAKVNGIPVAIRFKEQGKGSVGEALHGAVVPRESHPFFEAMGQYNRFFGQLLTTYNPAWIAVNFVRDYQTLISNAVADGRLPKGAGRKMAKAVFPAMRASIHIALTEFKPKTVVGKAALAGIRAFFKLAGKPDQRWLNSYNEAKMAGGLTSFIDRKGLEEQMVEIDRALNGSHGVDAAMQKVKGLLSFVELMSIPTELAPRLAAYHVMRTQGFSQEQSAVFSGEITVNFNMRGATKELRQLFLFFNPAVQGTAKMVKVMKQSPGRFAAIGMAWVGFGALMNLVGRAMGGEDDDGIDKLDKVPALKRSTSAVYNPDEVGGAIPIAYGYNAFYAVGHFMMDTILNKNSLETSVKRIASTTFEAFSPIGNGAFEHKSPIATGLKLTMPTVVHPMIEWVANENRFGSPIYKSQNAMTGVKDPDSYMNFNSANPISVSTMRTIHEMTGGNRFNRDGIDLNPAAIDHFIGSYAPGVIAETYKAMGVAVNKAKGRDVKNEKLPIIGRFQADVPEQWYDGAYRKVKEVVREREREILRTHNADAKSAVAKKNPRAIEAAAIISGVDKIVRDRAVLMEKARNNSDYSPADLVAMENRFEKDNRVVYESAVRKFLDMGYREVILGDN